MTRSSRFLCLLAVVAVSVGCVTTPPTPSARNISEIFEPLHTPNYAYAAGNAQAQPSGYSVGIVKLTVKENAPENWVTIKGTQSYIYGVQSFVNEYEKALEMLLTAKGVTVLGPFESYMDTTYPERSQCSYMIVPTLEINIACDMGQIVPMKEFNAPPPRISAAVPDPRWSVYASMPHTVTVKCVLRYEIIEPLTAQKLAIHRLESTPYSRQIDGVYKLVFRFVPTFDEYGRQNGHKGDLVSQEAVTKENTPGYNNWHNMDAKLMESLFNDFIPKTDSLLSVAEFAHLDQYKKDLQDKKVFMGPQS